MKNIFFTDESVEINWFNSEKYFFTDESVERQITDSISENLTDSDLESIFAMCNNFLWLKLPKIGTKNWPLCFVNNFCECPFMLLFDKSLKKKFLISDWLKY